MKLSKYNEYKKLQDTILVYNLKMFSDMTFESNDINEVKSYILSESHNEDFYKFGFLTDKVEKKETYDNYFKIINQNKPFMLNIITSYDCNCAYCFENITDKNYVNEEDTQKLTDYYFTEE